MLFSNVCSRLIRGSIRCSQLRTVVSIPKSSVLYLSCCVQCINKPAVPCSFNVRACCLPRRFSSGLRHTSTVTTSVQENVMSLDASLAYLRSKIVKEHYLSKDDITILLSDLSKHQEIPEGMCSLLLQCCTDFIPSVGGKEKIQLAKQIWDAFRINDYIFDEEDIQKLMELYKAARQPLANEPWISIDKSVISGRISLLNWMQCAAETGDIVIITEVLDRMKKQGLALDESTFACLILAYGRARDYAQVKNVLNTMKDAAVDPGLSTYIALMQAQIENDQPIALTVAQMRNEGMVPTDKQLASLIHIVALSKRDNLLTTVLRTKDMDKLSLELKNCAVELIHEGNYSVAIRLVAECDIAFGIQEAPTTFAAFLPKELVAANVKPAYIVSVCHTLQQTFPDHQSFLLAASEASLRDVTKTMISIELLKHVTPLRNHYFWPLAVRAKTTLDMVNILKLMQNLGLRLDFDTLVFYVFPNLIKTDTAINILKHLQTSCKLSVSSLLGPLVQALLNAKMLEEAVVLCKQYKQRTMDIYSMAKPLISCALSTKNYAATVTMLSLLSKSTNITDRSVDIIGLFLAEYSNKCSPADLEKMLKMIESADLKISLGSYEILSSKAVIKQNSLIPLLNAITNTALEGTSNFNPMPHPRDMGVDELEGHLIELKTKNLNTRGVLRRLLQVHCRLNNAERVLQIKKELDADGYTLSPGILASLFAMQLTNNDCDGANSTLKQLYSEHPSFVLDEHKIIDFCTLKLRNQSSKEDITSILKEFVNFRQHQGGKIKGGSGIQRNCQILIGMAQQTLGQDDCNSIKDHLRTWKFMQ